MKRGGGGRTSASRGAAMLGQVDTRNINAMLAITMLQGASKKSVRCLDGS